MTAALPIFDPTIDRGGSGRGVSFYKTVWKCARKASLDKETSDAADPGYSAKVGIVGHALLDIFYSGDARSADMEAIQVSDVAYKDPLAEAIRMVRAYLTKFPERDFWGDVIGCEVQFPEIHPATGLPEEADLAAIKSFFQVDLTARLDLIVDTKARHLPLIAERTGLVLRPGITIIDHKFKPGGLDGEKVKRPQKERNPDQKYGMGMQFAAYPPMWNLFNPARLCAQMIANIIVGQKEVCFQPTLIRPPEAHDIEVLRTWLASGELLAGTDVPNADYCYDEKYDSVCTHYASGRCDRA